MKKVSVIMPVKDAAQTASRAVQSIQSQTFKDWELIAVDDESTDQTPQIISAISTKDPRVRLKTNTQSGISSALNYGIACANSPLIARMDADDVSHTDRLGQQFSFLNENSDFDLVGSRVNYLGDPQSQMGYAAYVNWTNSLVSWDDIRKNRFVESPFAHPTVMFRKSLVRDDSGPYRQGDFPEDYELWLRWMNEGVRMAKLDAYLLDWYDPPERLSRKDPRYDPAAFFKTKAEYLAKWLKKEKFTERPIWIWGAGRITRKRAYALHSYGIMESGYIDIDPRKTGNRVGDLPVLHPDDLDPSTNPYVISYVGNRGARVKIRAYLIGRNFEEEQDFILAA